MKKRYEEVTQNLAMMDAALKEKGVNAQIQARQLYHDREEVTVHVRRIWAADGATNASPASYFALPQRWLRLLAPVTY
ncbi:hypothetical protein E05_46360 [Plautia stali symbiont]|nr:hypothetical protein E05_46360 [Plautia stali symbiont]